MTTPTVTVKASVLVRYLGPTTNRGARWRVVYNGRVRIIPRSSFELDDVRDAYRAACLAVSRIERESQGHECMTTRPVVRPEAVDTPNGDLIFPIDWKETADA